MKKQILLIFTIFYLFSSSRALSQCIVSGGNFRKPITYETIGQMEKDRDKFIRAGRKAPLIVEIPIDSTFRNKDSLNRIFGKSVFYPIFGEYRIFGLVRESEEDFNLRLKESKNLTLYFTVTCQFKAHDFFEAFNVIESAGLVSIAEIQERKKQEQERKEQKQREEREAIEQKEREAIEEQCAKNSRNGYGHITDDVRDGIIAEINILKTEYDEKLKKSRDYAEEILKGISNIEKIASDYELKKEWAYALYYYYKADKTVLGTDKVPSEDEVIAEYKEKVESIIAESKISTNDNYNEPNAYEYREYRNISLTSNESNKNSLNSKYKELIADISSGKPWIGDYDDFSLYDGWKELLVNAEQFFSKYPPFYIDVGKLEKKSADMKTRTYTYGAKLSFGFTGFYNSVVPEIKRGLEKVYADSWTEIPKNWPETSILDDIGTRTKTFGKVYKKRNSMLVKGIPLVESYSDSEIITTGVQKTIEMADEKLADMQRAYENRYKYMSAEERLMAQVEIAGFKTGLNEGGLEEMRKDLSIMRKAGMPQITTPLAPACFSTFLYDVKLNIINENGEILSKGKRKLLDSEGDYEFPGISPEISKLIEEKKAKLVADSLYLNYGAVASKEFSKTSRVFVKNLPDIQIDLKNVDIRYDAK